MREKKSAETRAKILEAALELFREKGFAETSMREVANRAKVATGLAYYYFASKDVIVHDFYQKAKDDLASSSESVCWHLVAAVLIMWAPFLVVLRKGNMQRSRRRRRRRK